MSDLKIKMVDLAGQTKKIRTELESSIATVLDSSQFIQGDQVKLFEENLAEHLDSSNVIGCANGTDAIQVALMALDLEPGDEILVPAFTYSASAEAVALLGLRPVFVDVDPKTFNIAVEKIEDHLSAKTKAIIPVHLYGQSADMEGLLKVSKKHNLKVIEDTAQSISCPVRTSNSKDQMAGTLGDLGTLSFFPSKNLGCFGDGGAVLVQEPALADRVRKLANHGQKSKYEFDFIGCNSRLDAIQAAILNVKLKYLDSYILCRQNVASFYDEHLGNIAGLTIPFRDKERSGHVFHQYTIKVSEEARSEFIDYAKGNGIPTQIYYPTPVHLSGAYSYLNHLEGDFPVSELLSKTVVSLPMHTELTQKQLNHIVTSIQDFFS